MRRPEYLGKRIPAGRYSSFDDCFHYFQFHREEERLDDLLRGEALQLSCLRLGFYLASWGCCEGRLSSCSAVSEPSSPLSNLVSAPAELWTLDADGYGESEIAKIRSFAKTLRPTLHDGASDVLVTKVMLETMSCVPAFDQNFNKANRHKPTTLRAAPLETACGRYLICRVAHYSGSAMQHDLTFTP